MSWLNLNQSLSSLKGQITNFATEVLSEAPADETGSTSVETESKVKELLAKCRTQELEIAALKKLNEELDATLQSERLSKKNGVREDEANWYWDPPPQTATTADQIENQYKVQIQALQSELSTLRERETIDLRPDVEEELRRLQEENRNLTSNLEDLDNQHQVAMERLLSLKKELQKNFEVLRQEHEDLKNANEEFTAETKNLLLKLGERDKEIENLRIVRSDYETLHHKYQNLERIHSLLRENAEKFQEENQDLHEEVFKLQEQVTKLEHDLEISTKKSELANMVPREQYEDLVKELKDFKNRKNSNHGHTDGINIDDNAKIVIENLKREISDLKHQVSLKDTENYELDHKLIKPEKIMQLYNKYINFELPLDYVGEIPRSDNIVMFKLETVFKTINSFKKNIDSLEHQLSEKNLNVNHLQTQIDDLTTENDFLTTDIQHFERELSEMKKNNDFLISELATLKNTSKLEPIIETHEDNLAKLETELADCNKMNKTFESEIKRIEKELSEVRTEKIILQESLNDLRSKYTTMLTELDMCKNQAKDLEELEHTTTSEQTKILKIKLDEIDELKKRLHIASTKNEQLSIDIHIIENDKVLLTKEVDELKNALKEKSNEHRELEILKITLDRKLEELENKLDEVIRHKNEIEEDKLKLEEKIIILQKSNNSGSLDSGDISKIVAGKSHSLEKNNDSATERSMFLSKIEDLKTELYNLQHQQEQLIAENKNYKNSSANNNNSALLQETLNELKTKNIQEEILNNEIIELKDNNNKLTENNLQMEKELLNTDTKIAHLEEEFDKLMSDLNEKDSLIDNLNATVNNSNREIQTLNKKVSDLEILIGTNNNEIKYLNSKKHELESKLQDFSSNSHLTNQELNELHKEKEELSKQILSLNDELSSKVDQISNLTVRLEELNNKNVTHTNAIDLKDKEIKELRQTVMELTDKLKVNENVSIQNDEYSQIIHEKQTMEKEISELQNTIRIKDSTVLEMTRKIEQLENACIEFKTVIDNTTTEKTELINLVNLKHNESIQYHNEIQRLNNVLLEQSDEFKRTMEEKEKTRSNLDCCNNCEKLRITLKEKDEIIMNLTHNATENERFKIELHTAKDSIQALTEKCDTLDKSLAIQLETVKKLSTENAQLSEQEQNSTKELERLRHHLVEMEESYTHELMMSEQKLTECQTRLHQVEERAKQSSTVYTSNSIRANQEVETLRNQIKLLEKQREDVQTKLSDAEDARSRSEAALTNLQVVLEQFQLDKERDIQSATEKIRNKMEDLNQENLHLMDEISRLNSKLEEAMAGLQAASRLGDQVETKTAQINDLKEQVRTLQASVTAAEERYYNAISNQQDKVDKNLVKNLVINYVVTSASNNHNKTQVLRILSTVLDFNQQECEKLGLVRSSNTTDSLAAEFVKFLQNESKPRAPLPNMMGIAQSGSRSTTPTLRKNSTVGPHNFEVGHRRNPSTGSNNLLFQNLDAVETSSQLSADSDHQPRVVSQLDTGVNQTRNTESAILKHVLKDM